MKIIGVRYDGKTFGERGDAKMLVFFQLDVPTIPEVNLYEMAYHAKREKYDKLRRDHHVHLDCKSLTYQPRYDGIDVAELDFLGLDTIEKIILEWEEDVKAQVEIGRKMFEVRERAKAHHMTSWLRETDDGFLVRLGYEYSNACGGAEHKYLNPRPFWVETNYRYNSVYEELHITNLDNLSEPFFDELEQKMATGYNIVMASYEAGNILEEKRKVFLEKYHIPIEARVSEDHDWRTGRTRSFIMANGPYRYPIELDLSDIPSHIKSAEAFDMEDFAKRVMGIDIEKIEAQNREAEARDEMERKKRNAALRAQEKQKKERGEVWMDLCIKAKDKWDTAPAPPRYRR